MIGSDQHSLVASGGSGRGASPLRHILPFVPLITGTRLGSYEITSIIGAGGMGEVYRPRDTKLERDVVRRYVVCSGGVSRKTHDSGSDGLEMRGSNWPSPR